MAPNYTEEDERAAHEEYVALDEANVARIMAGKLDGGEANTRVHNAWRNWAMIRAERNDARLAKRV